MRLGDIAIVYDGPHATPKKIKSGSVFLGISNLDHGRIDLASHDCISEEEFIKWTKRILPKEGDFVFSYETRLGEAALIPKGLKCCLGRRMGLIRPIDNRLNTKYLLYLWLSPQMKKRIEEQKIHGSTVERISIKELPNWEIPLPPLPEQERIAGLMSAYDDK
ncbi:MAG: restriction endonuclease subunit S, partial [Sphingobacteriia bacterium]